jgi:hypothetical protein
MPILSNPALPVREILLLFGLEQPTVVSSNNKLCFHNIAGEVSCMTKVCARSLHLFLGGFLHTSDYMMKLQVIFLHFNLNLSFNTEKILFHYRTFQIHIPEDMSKKIPEKLYVATKEQKPQEMLKSKEEKVRNQEQK